MTPRLRAAILNVKKLSSIHPHRTDLWIVEREAFEELLAAFDESEPKGVLSPECICFEFNARHCPIHQEEK